MLKATLRVLVIKRKVLNEMFACRAGRSSTASKRLFWLPIPRFDLFTLEEGYGQEWNVSSGMDFFRVDAQAFDEMAINGIVQSLEMENFQRNIIKRSGVYGI